MTTTDQQQHSAIDLMHAHRSIRAYTDQPVSDQVVRSAVLAGQAAATSSNVQAYCAIRVRDDAHRAVLAELAGPQEKVRTAPVFLVICGDVRKQRIASNLGGGTYDQKLEGFLISAIDAALFAQNMVLALEAMGLGTCYIGGLRNDVGRVVKTLRLPKGVYPLFGLCAGYPAEQPMPRPRLDVDSVLFEGGYPDDDEIAAHIERYDEVYRTYLADRGAQPVAIEDSWSGAMRTKVASVKRPDLAEVYRGQGAVLD